MKSLKNIKIFKFDYAQYVFEDSLGNNGVLQVDYKNNKYKTRSLNPNEELDPASVIEISDFAEELLYRKRNVNFASPK